MLTIHISGLRTATLAALLAGAPLLSAATLAAQSAAAPLVVASVAAQPAGGVNLQDIKAAPRPAVVQPLSARVDPRVELMAILFRLAGNPEYAQVRVPAYDAAIEAHFWPHVDHPAVHLARQLRASRSVSFDAVMSMAIHVTDIATLEFRAPLDAPDLSLERRWPRERVPEFLAALREFVRDADVAGFIAAQAPFFAGIERQLQETLDVHGDVTWFERFFGESPAGGFEVVLSPAAGGGNYGPRFVAPDGQETVYAILGVWQTDDAGNPRIDRRVVPTLVHEFSHSFVNHNVELYRADLERSGASIYSLVEQPMRAQAYGGWKTMLDEALVRAATARYILADEGAEAARRSVVLDQARGFIALDELFELLAEYEANRTRYPTLRSFMPRFVAWADDLARRAGSVHDAFLANRPRVTATSPADRATGVDATTTTIAVHFDRPMASGHSVSAPAGRDRFPDIEGVEWSDDRTTATFRVRLQPQREYVLQFNTPVGGSFRDVAGVPAAMYTLRFTTR
jgi:hypothetical protein